MEVETITIAKSRYDELLKTENDFKIKSKYQVDYYNKYMKGKTIRCVDCNLDIKYKSYKNHLRSVKHCTNCEPKLTE